MRTNDLAHQRQVARRLAAYIPSTLTRQILLQGVPVPGRPRWLTAATLFSDISGFTRMAEELATDGPRGAEELNRVLLVTFTAMINVIHDAGGAVSHFHGDAMTVYFPDEPLPTAAPGAHSSGEEKERPPAAVRALACAQLMQRLMATTFGRAVTSRPPQKDPVFHLTMKIGVGYGRCLEMIVGDRDTGLEFVLAGRAVNEAVLAEQQAESGQVIASRAVLAQAGLTSSHDFCQLEEVVSSTGHQAILEWDQVDEAALDRLVQAASPFVPQTIYERLQAPNPDFVAEHRPVTSLFVQFTGIDYENENAGNLLQLYYQWTSQIVARYGGDNGRVNRLLTGDKGSQLHIIFGAPVAPDSPDQAIRCALALQRAKPAFITSQKIGLAAGKVFACPVGSQERCEYTVVGDVVNLSARLTEVCAEDMVLTAGATAVRVENVIEFEQLEPVMLKGKQEPVSLFRATGERTAVSQGQGYFIRWQRPLIGRERELDLLLGGLDAALHSVGGVAAIYGPVGVGKTRLLAASVDYWLQAGGEALVGACQPHTADLPFGPWITIWRDFFELRSDMTVEAQVTAVVSRTQELFPECGDDVGLWGDVLSLPFPQAEAMTQLPAEVRQARFFTLMRRCLQAAATARSLFIILEDIHWADPSSLDLFDELSQLVNGRSIYFALTTRPVENLKLAVLNRPVCTPIMMSDLSAQEARELVCSILDEKELPPILEQRLGLRDREGRSSAINPLFLEESLKVMLETGILRKNGRLQINEERLANMQVPDTVYGLLLARLDRLPAASRDLLQVASVIGRQFGLETLTKISENTPHNLIAELLTDLSEAEMTQLVASDPELTYLFQHAMTRDVAYESLPYTRRQALHAAIADWLVERYADNLKSFYPVLAYHYGQTDLHDKGMSYALAAAHEARAMFANKEAVELYRLAESHLKVLGEEAHWETAVDLYLNRGKVMLLLGDFAGVTIDGERALSLANSNQDVVRVAQSYNLLAELKYRQAEYEETRYLAGEVLVQSSPPVPQEELARAYQWVGMAAGALSDYDAALQSLHRAEEISSAIYDNRRLATVLEAMAFVYFSQQKLEAALEIMQRGILLSRRFSNPANVGFALNNIALIQFSLGQVDAALATLDEAWEIAQNTSLNLLAFVSGNQAEVLAYLGRFDKAQASFEKALELFTAMDDEYGLIFTHLLWGYEYHGVLGNWLEAEDCFEKAQHLIEQRPESYVEEEARLLIGLGQVALNKGMISQAESALARAEKIIEEKDFAWWRTAVAYFMGMVKTAQNEPELACQYFRRGVAAVNDRGCPDYLPLILLEQARLAASEEEKLALLERCVQAVKKRARHLDRLACLKTAGYTLANCRDARLRELGEDCLKIAES